ncbi:MAG: PEP-CTERM sorting domain-containing protein [Rhodanobacteraceae bacterium]|nr:MAG: PEP-CTERM sorting domain-containing protein [Rhodanobacteraceae bacterium]
MWVSIVLDTSLSQFSGVYAAVPEPRFMWIFGAALLGLFGWRRSIEAGRQRASHAG